MESESCQEKIGLIREGELGPLSGLERSESHGGSCRS